MSFMPRNAFVLSSVLKWTLESGTLDLLTLRKSFQLPVPQFPSLEKWDNNSIYLISSCENMCKEQCLAHTKHSVSMYYYDYKDIDHYSCYQERNYVLVSDGSID